MLVHDLAVGRDAQVLPTARPSELLDPRAEAVRRVRAKDLQAGVPELGGVLVEAVAEPPGRAAAEGRQRRAGTVVLDARIEPAEAAVQPHAHPRPPATLTLGRSGRTASSAARR